LAFPEGSLALSGCLAFPEGSLALSGTCPASACPAPWIDS
jgi:hypothetical protein